MPGDGAGPAPPSPGVLVVTAHPPGWHPDSPETAAVRWLGMVLALAIMPGVAAKLRAEHAADDRGHCRTCTPRTSWPCRSAALAADAEKIGRGRR